jgi:putative ABC transport system permease protein
MVSMLDRKLLRDLVRLRWQVVTIALVVASGIAVFVGALSTYRSLWLSKEGYYEEAHFADVFATVKRAPLDVVERLRGISGVVNVEPRLALDVTLLVPGLPEPASARLVTLPPSGVATLNRAEVRRGRPLDPAHPDEVLLSEAFAGAHHIEPGDTLSAVMNGRKRTLSVVGIALSPEFIFAVRPGELMADDRRFGVLWSSYETAATAFDMNGTFDDVALTISAGTSAADVIGSVDHLLAPYGAFGAYPRKDQTSERFLSQEIRQLEGSATLIPSIFLGVAAFLLNVVLGRVVATQREQIATLKALGYGHRTIGFHYAKLALVIVLLGALLGVAGGAYLGGAMTRLYARFFRFPLLVYELDASLAVAAVLVSLGGGLGGALGIVRGVVRLAPATAMGPPAPPRFRSGLLYRIGVERAFGPMGRMVVRDLERRPWRALLTSAGIASAVAILIAGTFSLDAVDTVMDTEFNAGRLDDATIMLNAPVGAHAVLELEHVQGVRHAEGLRVLPARLRYGHRSRDVGVLGLERASSLRRILTRDSHVVPVPEDGVVMSLELGRRLGLAVGDAVHVEVLEGAKPELDVPVRALVDDLIGLTCYASLETVSRWMGEGEVVNAALAAVDAHEADAAYAALGNTPRVAGVTTKRAMFETFERTTAQYSRVFTWILAGFAAVIAIGIVYNAARILVSERERELATLRVMGFTRREVSRLLLSELATEIAVGIPLGFGFGWLIAAIVVRGVDPELFRFPLIISADTYAFAALVVLGAGALSALRVRERLDRLDLVEVLKTRE